MSRRTLIAGNWKMHTTAAEAQKLAGDILDSCENIHDRDVLLAPPFTALAAASLALGDSPVILAGQNVCWEEQGAFTGEISPLMLKDQGATAAIVGHSERRQIFGESDEMINNRVVGGLRQGLMIVLCIGETLSDREGGLTFTVLEKQVREGLAGVSAEDMARVVIAYEPVWAIGTGKTATTEQAQEAHGFIRKLIEALYEKGVAEQLRILYGGSVKPANVDDLMSQPDIDGALVGGAALDGESFGRIINYQ
jgi:triosephosphate isomerase